MKLTNPPYLQVACDQITREDLQKVLAYIPKDNPRILIEAGTPLIKRFGIDIVKEIKSKFPDVFVIADLKTLDVAALEVQIVAEAKADAIAISGLANKETILSGIKAGKERKIATIVDMMNVKDPLALLKSLKSKPDIVLFHRGIDAEGNQEHPWNTIAEVKGLGSLVAVAGGLTDETSKKAIRNGADIIIIGRFLTAAENPKARYKKILELL